MIEFRRPTAKRDWLSITKESTNLLKAAIFQDYLGAAVSLVDLHEAAKGSAEDQVIGAIAWTWIQEISINAFIILAKERRIRSELNEIEVEKVIFDLLNDLLYSEPAGRLNHFELINPALNSTVKATFTRMHKFVELISVDSALSKIAVERAMHRALADSSAKVLQESPKFYATLSNTLLSPLTTIQRREIAWARHASYVQGLFYRSPIFSLNEDELMPLSQIYIKPRGYWYSDEEYLDEIDKTIKRRPITVVHDLTDKLLEWAKDSKLSRDEKIKVVMGGPGSGKSSFGRAFASHLVSEGESRIIYINLQHMELRSDFQNSIENHLASMHSFLDPSSDSGLQESPFELAKYDPTGIIFFFDGLDELSAKDDEAQSISLAFLQDLQNMISKYEGNIDLRALVLGRNSACQEAAKRIRLHAKNLLQVAPFTPIIDNPQLRHRNQLTSQLSGELRGDKRLIKRDQRVDFWKKWVSQKGGARNVPKIFADPEMVELTSEPLFLLLLILTGYVGKDWKEAAKNKNIVYRTILDRIHERNVNKNHESSAGLDRKDFYRLMETIGLATWHGNGRTGTEEDYQRLRAVYLGASEDERLKDTPGAKLKNVAMQIHARKGEEARSGFEFIHKSFGEYLTARGVLNFAFDLSKQDRMSYQEKSHLWAKIGSFTELDANVAKFLSNEVKLLDIDAAKMLKGSLEKLINWISLNGIPVHLLDEVKSETFRHHEIRNANSSKLLVSLASELSLLGTISSKTAPNSPKSLLKLFDFIGQEERRFLTSITIEGAHPISLYCVDFSRRNLTHISMPRARLDYSNFVGATLQGALLNFSSLRYCDFDSTNMSYSSFHSANFEGASLRNAALYNSQFQNANFRGADLSGANLAMATFRNADLDTAIGITQRQIDSSVGDSATTLPPGINKPAHWIDIEEISELDILEDREEDNPEDAL